MNPRCAGHMELELEHGACLTAPELRLLLSLPISPCHRHTLTGVARIFDCGGGHPVDGTQPCISGAHV